MKIAVFATFHPAAALYNAKYGDQLTADFQQVGKELLKKGIAPV
jgi:uracil-DNA glycosylase